MSKHTIYLVSSVLSLSFVCYFSAEECSAQLKSYGTAKVQHSSARWTRPLGGLNITAGVSNRPTQLPVHKPGYRPGTKPNRPVTLPSYRWNHYYGGWGGIYYGDPWYSPAIVNYQPTQVIQVPAQNNQPTPPEPPKEAPRKKPLVIEFNQETGKSERRYLTEPSNDKEAEKPKTPPQDN